MSQDSPAISVLSEEEKDRVTDEEVEDEEPSKEQEDNDWILAICSSPEPQGVTQPPEPHGMTQAPEPQEVTQAPEPQEVTHAPEPQRVTQSPEPQSVTHAPEPQRVTQSPEPQRVTQNSTPLLPARLSLSDISNVSAWSSYKQRAEVAELKEQIDALQRRLAECEKTGHSAAYTAPPYPMSWAAMSPPY